MDISFWGPLIGSVCQEYTIGCGQTKDETVSYFISIVYYGCNLVGKSVGVESSLALRYQRKTEINAVQTSLLVGDSNKIGALVVVGASPHDPLGLYLRPGMDVATEYHAMAALEIAFPLGKGDHLGQCRRNYSGRGLREGTAR
jgi:hypothetical protein